VLELDEVGFAYRRGDWVFRGVNLVLQSGTTTAVLGPNGTGKTTLVRCAAGLLDAGEGTVRRDGEVGFVPQARTGAFAYRVIDMVLMGRARRIGMFGVPRHADVESAEAALDRVGISDLRHRRFPTLSGGEQQLVLIARAIAADCPYLVLDEPSTGLDLHNQSRILTLVRELADQGLAVLLTTHHPDQALFLADSVVLMMGPNDVRVGDADHLLTDASLSSLYRIPVRSITYQRQHGPGRAIVTEHGLPIRSPIA